MNEGLKARLVLRNCQIDDELGPGSENLTLHKPFSHVSEPSGDLKTYLMLLIFGKFHGLDPTGALCGAIPVRG